MAPEIEAALIGLAVVVIGALAEAVRRAGKAISDRLDANDQTTAKAAAAAAAAAEQTDWRQRATALSLELDAARRRLALVQALPGCLACRAEIERIIADAPLRRRITDPTKEPNDGHAD